VSAWPAGSSERQYWNWLSPLATRSREKWCTLALTEDNASDCLTRALPLKLARKGAEIA